MDDARVILRGEFDTADIKKGSKEVEGVLERLGKTVKALGLGVIIKKSFDKATKAINDCVSSFKEAQVAVTKFNTIAKTLGFTSQQINGLQEYATELQQMTGMSDEAILGAEQLLLATNALDEEGIKKATLSCANLAVAMGTDITASAQALAIALQAPSDGLTRLRRSGILFTDEEEALVKALDEAGKKAEAQAVILDKIQSRYEGVAKAVGDTNVGTLNKISEVWGDIKENLGEAIIESIEPSLQLLLTYLDKIKGWSADAVETAKTNNLISDINGTVNANVDVNETDYMKIFRTYFSALGKFTDEELQKYLDNVTDGYNKGISQTLEIRGMLRDTLNEDGFMTRDTKTLLKTLGYTWGSIKEAEEIVNGILGMTVNKVDEANADIESDSPIDHIVPSAEDQVLITEATNNIDALLKSLGSNSTSYKKAQLAQQIEDVTQAILDAEALGLWDKADQLKEIKKALEDSSKTIDKTALEQLQETFTLMGNNGDYAQLGFNAFAEGIDALGQALAGNEDAWGNWAKSVIDSISSVIMSHGYEMLAEGTLKLFNTITMAEGMAEIAKSAGVIALGGVVKGLGNSFESGGIVGGSGYTGDRHMIFANAGELILNRTQQRAIASQLSNGSGGAIAINFNGTVLGDQESVSSWVYDGIQRAKANGVVS